MRSTRMKKEVSGYWMFMCNPNKWQIDRFLETGEVEDTYSISNYHKDYFKIGQQGIIRVGSDARSKKVLGENPKLFPGVYAVVRVPSEPELLVTKKGDFWLDKDESLKPRLRVRIEYTSIHLSDPILLAELKETPIAENDPVLIDGIQASTYPITKSSFDLISSEFKKHLQFSEEILVDTDEEQKYSEGQQHYRQHLIRERNSKLMKEAKALFIRQNGHLYCEICGYNFEDHFGDRGRNFIEGHHSKYVSELADSEETKITDIVMLCPNCHRMIHRKPRISFEDLKASYR